VLAIRLKYDVTILNDTDAHQRLAQLQFILQQIPQKLCQSHIAVEFYY